MIYTAEGKKVSPKEPEPLVLSDEENDNMFFALGVVAEGYEAGAEIALVVDMKGTNEEDCLEYLYTVILDSEDLDEIIEWAQKAKRYIKHTETHGSPIKLTMGEDMGGNYGWK